MTEPVFIHEKKTWHTEDGEYKRDRESYVVLTPDCSVEAWRMSSLSAPYERVGGVEVHSPTPLYEGHQPLDRPCSYVPGGICYTDGSSLAFDYIEYAFDNPKSIYRYLLDRLEGQ